jgi:hypothetical protein
MKNQLKNDMRDEVTPDTKYVTTCILTTEINDTLEAIMNEQGGSKSGYMRTALRLLFKKLGRPT